MQTVDDEKHHYYTFIYNVLVSSYSHSIARQTNFFLHFSLNKSRVLFRFRRLTNGGSGTHFLFSFLETNL